MQYSVINWADLNSELRIDAEYYRKEILERLDILNRHNKKRLENIANFIIGPFGSTVTADQYIDVSEYRYVRNQDIDNFAINNDAPAFIPKAVYDSLPKFHIQENDLLITVVGTLGKVAIATEKDARSIFSCKSTIVRAAGVNPFYLLTYLNTDTGNLFSLRGKRGAIQEGLNLTDLKEIQVFVPSDGFQLTIEKSVRQAFATVDKSRVRYTDAQTTLLSELGLADWQPSHRVESIRNFSEVWGAGRMDAEYYQTKYDDIVNAVKGYAGGWDTLGNLVSLKDGNFNPDAAAEYQYIELANITGNGEIADCTVGLGADLPSRARRKVSAGDVIVSSIEGSLDSIALIGDEYNGALCSTGFHVVNSQSFNSETLLVLLKSIAGQLQLKKGCSGTILSAISKDELGKVVLPLITSETQVAIQQKIAEATALRQQSRRLLESAKRAVEIAIEQDEATAIAWLESERAAIIQ